MGSLRFVDGAPEVGRPVFVGASRVEGEAHIQDVTQPAGGVPSQLASLVLDVVAGRVGPVPGDHETTAHLLRFHGLGGLGYVWATKLGEPGAALARVLEPTYRTQQLAGAVVQESADRARTVLSDAGVPTLLFKGAALVRASVYADVGERPMDDADLLVPQDQAEAAARILTKSGYQPWRSWQSGREGWSDAFTLRDSRSPKAFPCDIDLHWRTEYGALRFGNGGSVLWEGWNSETHCPAPEAHLLVIAEHFLKHLRVRPHLLAYADLARLSATVTSWDTFTDLAVGRWWTAAIGLLLEGIREELDADVPRRITERLIAARPRVRRRAALLRPSACVGQGTAPGNRVAGVGRRWQLGPGSAGAARELLGTIFPPHDWLRARYGRGSPVGLRLLHGQAVLRWASGRGASPLSPNQEGPEPLDSGQVARGGYPVDTPMGRL